jgi:hypothetical protein
MSKIIILILIQVFKDNADEVAGTSRLLRLAPAGRTLPERSTRGNPTKECVWKKERKEVYPARNRKKDKGCWERKT